MHAEFFSLDEALALEIPKFCSYDFLLKCLSDLFLQEGKVPKLDKILEDSDEEILPDQEIQVPEHKVKLIVGPGGEKIKYIQRKSKCQIQVTSPTAKTKSSKKTWREWNGASMKVIAS